MRRVKTSAPLAPLINGNQIFTFTPPSYGSGRELGKQATSFLNEIIGLSGKGFQNPGQSSANRNNGSLW